MDKNLFKQLDDIIRIKPEVRLFVFDTFQLIRSRARRDNNVYGKEYDEMKMLKQYADEHKIAIVLVHHNRKLKDEDDLFNQINGSQALMGAADTIWMLAKKKREDDLSRFATVSRKGKGYDLNVRKEEDCQKWTLIETEDDSSQAKWRREYEESSVVQTIKEMMKGNPMGWKVTASEMLNAVVDVKNVSLPITPATIGREIARFDSRLREDDIVHEVHRNREHWFLRKPKYYGGIPMTVFDKNDD